MPTVVLACTTKLRKLNITTSTESELAVLRAAVKYISQEASFKCAMFHNYKAALSGLQVALRHLNYEP